MQQPNFIMTTQKELDSIARFILNLQKEPFFFIRCGGNFYMNKNMKGIRKVREAIRVLWQYDCMENDEIMGEVDAAYDAVKKTAGETAADQLWRIWGECAGESRKKRAEEKARSWVFGNLLAMTDEDWEEICAAGYDSDFVKHGLFRVFSDLYDKNHDTPAYREYLKNWSEAAFVYGYQLGKAAAVKASQDVNA